MQKMDGRRFALNLLIESWTLPSPPSTNSDFTGGNDTHKFKQLIKDNKAKQLVLCL